jgi:hypothetical protein
VYVSHVTREGRSVSPVTPVFRAVTGEELVSWPTVAATEDGVAVAWTDRDNGRVRFARLDAQGAMQGRVTIVHDGMDAPQHVLLGYNGHDFGIAATLRTGVYFVRLNADGSRNGRPSVLSEGDAVRSLDAMEWDGRTYGLTFTVQREGSTERVQQHVVDAS